MASSYLPYNPNTKHGASLSRALTSFEQGMNDLVAQFATMDLMKDPAASGDAVYDAIRTEYGFPTSALAHAGYDELNSALSKVTVDTEVSNVYAALKQLFAKYRS